jgi:DNA repair protein RecN (Recombination protein N)
LREGDIVLVHLSVKDIALIDALELELAPGMTVLTGETGAGKSILVEALTLLLGERASVEVIRTGTDEASVSGQFALVDAQAETVTSLLHDFGMPPLDDGALVLRRVVSRAGRHKQFINGALCTVAQLRAIAEPLVDFTGQHAHQALLRPGAQLELLDVFGGHDTLRTTLRTHFDHARALAVELRAVREAEQDKDRRLDVIRFYLEEIEALDPRLGEDDELALARSRLMNAGKLRAAVDEARSQLTDGADDALSRVQRAASALQKAGRDDPELLALSQTLSEAMALIDDVGRSLARHGDVDDDPVRLQGIEDRLDALQRVCRKHGGTLASVIAEREKLSTERDALERATEKIDALTVDLHDVTQLAAAAADALTAARVAASHTLASAIADELHDLGMGSARVAVRVEPLAPQEDALVRRDDGRGLAASGSDRVELMLGANAGEDVLPLAKVASGGELSRVLLAVKRVLLARDPVPVSIFDEVDVGVGGAVGEAIGEKLQAIARGRQVLCITHLPQIASRGAQHLLVEKAIVGGRTVSRVRTLDDAGRVDELSRMLGGREITDAVRRHAQEMLASGVRVTDAPKKMKARSA